MPRIKRRQFLQFAGSALASIGLSQLDFQRRSLNYGKVLAQSTPRKLALLVGINKYPQAKRFRELFGCVNDVELQQHLLTHRFDFKKDDILTLTDNQASREAILTAFEEHLIKQAKPGDVVVFHFSGHGSFVLDPNPINPSEPYNSTFVPADDSSRNDIVNDITGKTLFLLMSGLKKKTENITVVLDSCHSGGGTRGNIRVRSVDNETNAKASPEELAFQEKWREELELSPEELREARRRGVAAGVVIASTKPKQLAADYTFTGFAAGAFTYLLTQYLWQQTDAVNNVIDIVDRNIAQLPVPAQNPLVEVQPGTDNGNKPIYFIPRQVPPAEAVVLEVNNNQAIIWLGGIEPESMDAFGEGAVLTTVGTNERGSTNIKLISRDGLLGTAEIEGQMQLQPGQPLQEYARSIPPNINLRIGLDPSLDADTNTAKTALEKINRIQAVLAQSGNEPYPQQVHYILSRMTSAYQKQLQEQNAREIPPEGSIGLFSQSLELMPKSFAQPGETIEAAISRLRPKFKSLLAARVVKLTLNAQSSELDVRVTMKPERGKQLIAEVITPRSSCRQDDSGCTGYGSRGESLPAEEPFQLQIENREEEALYLGIISIDPTGSLTVIFPNNFQPNSDEELIELTKIKPKETLLVPDPEDDPFVLVEENLGRSEILVIASEQPLTDAMSRLRSLRGSKGRSPTELIEPVDIIDAMLSDLRTQVRSRSQYLTSGMAALSITYEVVERL
ncbi:MAG: caspase family protein [Coleofasciculaceae cyanobacterium]